MQLLLNKNDAFETFLDAFQEIDLPITLTEDLSTVFSSENRPLKDEEIAEFIVKIDDEIDEYTEFVPCFQLKDTEYFKAVVYWKGMLMESKYVIAIYSLVGEPIRVKELSKISHDDMGVTRSIATIDEDWLIMIAKGTDDFEKDYNAQKSQMLVLEILPDGQIMKTDKR